MAANALSVSNSSSPVRSAPISLVCLATPFAYYSPTSSLHTLLAHSAIGWLVASLAVVIAWAAGLEVIFSAFYVFVPLFLLVSLAAALAFDSIFGRFLGLDYRQGDSLPATADIHLLRMTRDEASLPLGTSLAIHALSRMFYLKTDFGTASWSLRGVAVWAGALAASLGAAFGLMELCKWLVSPRLASLTDSVRWAWIGLLTVSIPASAYIFFSIVSAMAVGFHRIFLLPWRTVEVDVAPNSAACSIRVFSNVETGGSVGLRHGVYDANEVVEHIALILHKTARGLLGSACRPRCGPSLTRRCS